MISNWSKVESVPKSYIFPPGERPDELIIAPFCNSIPIIDLQFLSSNRTDIITQIMKASQDYGFFQLINHGVTGELMRDVMLVGEELFALPIEDKARLHSDDPNKLCKMKMSIDYAREKVHYWRELFQQPCHPLEDYINDWPTNPERYREVAGRYAVEVRKVSLMILDLIWEGLGLENGYRLKEEFSQQQWLTMNHYPKCPDPSLVLGLPSHCDPHMITLLNQGNVPGLQVYKDHEWFYVEPIPDAFVVNIGYTLEIISNGKLKSGVHRVVTNSDKARTTIVNFIFPSLETHIEPAKKLVHDSKTPPLFKDFIFKDFFVSYLTDIRDGNDPLLQYIVQDDQLLLDR